MHMTPVVSSNISSVGYDDATNTLYVQFNHGGTYKYNSVPKDVYEDFISDGSPGSFFASDVKGQYGYSKA